MRQGGEVPAGALDRIFVSPPVGARLRVMHVPFGFFPDSVGGTEVYVDGLVRALRPLGIESVVVAPDEIEATYQYRRVLVHRFRVGSVLDVRQLYDEGDPQAATAFARLLERERPDLVHLHALTRGASLRIVRESHRRGLPVAFTYHTPTASCVRGTLLRWGEEVCDGLLRVRTCASCVLDRHGVGWLGRWALAGLPPAVGRLVARLPVAGDGVTALRMTELVALRQRVFRALVAEVDAIVALCDWSRDLLVRNGVPAGRIVLSRHGLPDAGPEEGPPPRRDHGGGRLRLAYLGRLDPVKGVDLVVSAVRTLPEAPLELHVYGVVQGVGDAAYRRRLATAAAGDGRIAFHDPVPNDQVVALLREHDALAVPSRWLETGPLVVLEAFAAGVPVVGSALGGIAELVRDGVDGLLVGAPTVEAWRSAIARLSTDAGLLPRLRAGVRPPRTMAAVASEMAALYRALAGSRARAVACA